MKSKDTLRTEANDRTLARSSRTPRQQLKLLDAQGKTAKRERARLTALIKESEVDRPIPPKTHKAREDAR